MANYSMAVYVYGKQGSEQSGGYQELYCAPGIRQYKDYIDRALSFQWESLPKYQGIIYPSVWYIIPLDEERALLFLFEDAGNDPRPHTLRRTVGLCYKAEHEGLIATLQAGYEVKYQLNTSSLTWEFEINSEVSDKVAHWERSFLDKGNVHTYYLKEHARVIDITKQPSHRTYEINPPPLKNKASMKSFILHLTLIVIGIILGVAVDRYFLSSKLSISSSQPQQSHNFSATTPTKQSVQYKTIKTDMLNLQQLIKVVQLYANGVASDIENVDMSNINNAERKKLNTWKKQVFNLNRILLTLSPTSTDPQKSSVMPTTPTKTAPTNLSASMSSTSQQSSQKESNRASEK